MYKITAISFGHKITDFPSPPEQKVFYALRFYWKVNKNQSQTFSPFLSDLGSHHGKKSCG